MPSKTEEYLALAQRTANGLTRYWGKLDGLPDHRITTVQVPICGSAYDLCPAPGCHRLRRL